ncbi:Chromosome partition protein Smc [uncultured archaeon]|nr:Chromosome partition protein Smc [uncultured archaeon]
MTYIKKLVMQGFKSFVKKTELPFTEGINVILGPNGSGKSNVTDALCFVLGRLSVKSMRAAKAGNLIFMGSKNVPAAKEASVELVFDNLSRIFSIEQDEISIKRIVRKNGLSIYKINEETKTRQDVLGLLAQAGIDPNGFNIILQGEIQNFVRMNGEERRGIIEEVAGISIYESRKEKSLHELEKTEEKLKEITAILRERTAYLNNLEKERQQALKFKKLEADVQKYKASIIFHDLSKKKKEIEGVEKEIDQKNKEVEKVKKKILDIRAAIEGFESKVGNINGMIQKSAGIEQEKLNQEIANTRAELAGLTVKLDNYEKKLSELERQKQDLQETVRNNELSIRELQKESPSLSQKSKELAKKKQDLEKLEEERKKFYTTKAELRALRERLQDKQGILQSYNSEATFLIKQIENIGAGLFDKKFDEKRIDEIKVSLRVKKEELEGIEKRERELQQIIHTSEFEISRQEKVIENIAKMDMCPLCKSKITKEHISNINKEVEPRVSSLKKEIEMATREINDINKKRSGLKEFIEKSQEEIVKREADSVKMSEINSKKEQIKGLQEKIDRTKQEISEFDKKRKYMEENFDENSGIEQKCELLRVEIQEISLRSEETVNSEVSFKQRELERAKISLKQMISEHQELEEEVVKIKKLIKEKEELVEKRKQQEEELSKKFQKLIAERDQYQTSIRENESEMLREQNKNYSFEQEMNNFKISKAKVGAEIENLEIEMLNFPNVEIIRSSRESLSEKLNSVKETLVNIGSVNLRALEVYDSIKQEYDAITEKVEIISKEKEGIMKIIQEIDIKKKKTFFRTLESLNEIFSRNFAQLSVKGEVYLELENKKEPFEGGVGIVVKTGHGKYFDVTSLSGGEQTLVALSLIFGIQELKPYSFYILDEIDAALDKRNSERLAGLLRKYMEKGQYIVITHNDEVISRATNLYGVSMNEGVSKVVSLKI